MFSQERPEEAKKKEEEEEGENEEFTENGKSNSNVVCVGVLK